MITKVLTYEGHGYIRKTKVGLVSCLVLGSILTLGLTSQGVSAAENKPNSTENLPSISTTTKPTEATTQNSTAPTNATNKPTPTESRPGVPKDLDTSVNEDFIKQFPYGERFKDEDGVPATRTKAPDVALRFKPKDYEKTVTRKINYKVNRTGATISRIYQTIRYYGIYEFEKGTPEVREITEAEVPVLSEKGTPEINDVPEAEVPVVSEKGTPEINLKEEFSGGVVPLDPPTLEVPKYKGILTDKGTPEFQYGKDFLGGTVPNDALVIDKPNFDGVVSQKGTPEILNKLEFTGGVVPMDAPQLDKPELKVTEKPQIVSEQPKTPTEGNNTPTPKEPLKEQNRASENKPTLPNTGTSNSEVMFSSLGALGILGLLGIGKLRKSTSTSE